MPYASLRRLDLRLALSGASFRTAALALPLALLAPTALAQTASVAAFQQDLGTVEGKPKQFVLRDVTFNGNPIESSAIQVRELKPGVHEITSTQPTVGTWSFHLVDDSFYYGMGERFGDLDHAHTVMKNVSRDTGYAKGSSSYVPMPFFMSTAGYGLWVDTYSAATFDFNISSPDIIVTLTGDKLRLVMMQGPGFPKILDRFTALVGRTELPPYWAFAPWKARDVHFNEADVAEDLKKTRDLGLPASVLLIDSPWTTGYNSYEFSRKQFPHPEAMIAGIHKAGFKLILWHTPYINNASNQPTELGPNMVDVTSSNFAEAATKGYFVRKADGTPYLSEWWKGKGALIDFTNPAATTWWQQQVGKAVLAGADGFKDDDGEGNFIGDAHFADGSDVRTMRMKYGVLYNRAMEGVIQKQLKGNGVLFMRTGSVGSHNLAMFWGGDNEGDFSQENGLPGVVRAGLSAGMSGVSLWFSDLGGYLKKGPAPDDPAVFMRWTQYSAFSPGMEVMSQTNRGPWDYGDAALANYRRFAVLHMSLFPYRFAAAQESASTGMPMMRALVLTHQLDPLARKVEDEYEFGPDLLVAPMLALGTQRSVYFPEGDWLDLWTGKQMPSRQSAVIDVPMDSAAAYVRAGSILAKIPDDVMTLVPSTESGNHDVPTLDDRRVYDVYPGPAHTITDFEGRTVSTVIDASGGKLTLDGKPARVTVRLPFATVSSFSVDDKTLPIAHEGNVPSVSFSHTAHSTVTWTR